MMCSQKLYIIRISHKIAHFSRWLHLWVCRVLFGSGHLSSVWGHSVHFAKFSMLRYSKGYTSCSHSQFHPTSTKPYRKHPFRGKHRLLLFLAICQILKVHCTLNIRYLSYIASIHKAMLVSSGKGSSRSSRPLGILLLALLDCVSRVNGVAWASVIVRNANVLTKCTFGIYFEILISFFKTRLKFNIMANGKFSKCYYPYTYDSYSTNFF